LSSRRSENSAVSPTIWCSMIVPRAADVTGTVERNHRRKHFGLPGATLGLHSADGQHPSGVRRHEAVSGLRPGLRRRRGLWSGRRFG
jgi:hypothetical protein